MSIYTESTKIFVGDVETDVVVHFTSSSGIVVINKVLDFFGQEVPVIGFNQDRLLRVCQTKLVSILEAAGEEGEETLAALMLEEYY